MSVLIKQVYKNDNAIRKFACKFFNSIRFVHKIHFTNTVLFCFSFKIACKPWTIEKFSDINEEFSIECKEEWPDRENENVDKLIEESSSINPLAYHENDSFINQENRLHINEKNQAAFFYSNGPLNWEKNPLSLSDSENHSSIQYERSLNQVNPISDGPPLPLECILLEEKQTTFPCELCDKVFKYKRGMREHMRRCHTDKTMVDCSICGAKCSKFSLSRHKRTQHMKSAFECKKCGKNFNTKEILDVHTRKKHKKYHCLFCNKIFPDNKKVNSHMRIYHDLRPYPCPACNRPFTTKQGMHQHLLLHTGKRPYACDICGETYIQKSNLNFHRKSHPGPLPPVQPTSIAHIVKKFTQILEYKRRKQGKGKKKKENERKITDQDQIPKEDEDRDEEKISEIEVNLKEAKEESREKSENIHLDKEKLEENKLGNDELHEELITRIKKEF